MRLSQEERLAIQDAVKKPRRKWRRRALWLLVILPLGVIAGVLVIGQTSVMQMIVEPILEDQLGIDVSSGSIHLMPTGEIVINNAVCKADSIKSRAGSLIEFERATISVNWWGVIKGSGQVRSIVIEKPIVRVSQDIETGVLNLAAMDFKQGGGGGATPAIEIIDGLLQIAEHDKDSYRVLKELSIRGRLSEQTNSGVSAFEFVALPTEPSMSSMSGIAPTGLIGLTGQLSQGGIDGVLDGVRLEDWPADIVPSRSRGMYERLALAGNLAPTRFHVSPDGLVEIVLRLEGVALNLPFDDSGSVSGSVAAGDLLRMRQTQGVIRFGTSGLSADITGLIDEIVYNVDLDFNGLDAQSPFEATLVTDFRLDEHFRPAQFLPPKVMSKLDRFENPVADVHAVLQILRVDEPDAKIQVSGRAELSNGSAIYKKFRYPFGRMSGVIEFDPQKLVVSNITGVGPTGATLVANGLFSPLGEHSIVTLDLEVNGVAIDEHLMAALEGSNRKLVDALFSEREYARLLDEGMVLTRGDAELLGQLRRQAWDRLDGFREDANDPGMSNMSNMSSSVRLELAQELAKLDRQLEAPVFDFGGKADVHVRLVRHPERASDNRWTTDIHAKLPKAGLVSKHFSVPIMAQGVEIVINEKGVELSGGHYTGLGGGEATVDVTIDLTKENAQPIIEIVARGFPIDRALIAAIPGYYDEQSDDPDDISMRKILDRMNLSGLVDCDAIIGPRSNGRLGYDIEATVLQGAARPDMLSGGTGVSPEPITLDDIYGTIYITEELVIVGLNGLLASPEQPLAPTPIEILTQLTMPRNDRDSDGAKRVGGLLTSDFGPALPGPRLYATAYGDGIDLAMPLEHAIAVISPRIARDLLEKKSTFNLDGVVGMGAVLEGIIGGSIDTTLTVDRIDELGFDFHGARYEVGSSWGRSEFVLASEPTIAFDGFRVSLKADGEDAGVLSLDGMLPLARAGRYIEVVDPNSLAIAFAGGTFESPITQYVIDRFSNPQRESWFKAHELGGRFDLGVTLTPQLGMHKIKDQSQPVTLVPTKIDGSLSPRSISLMMGDERAHFEEVSGQLVFEGFEGTVEHIHAANGRTEMDINGRWTMHPGEGLGIDLLIDAKGDLLTGPVRTILPDAVDNVIDRLAIESQGEVVINGLQIVGSGIGQDHAVYDITGKAHLEEGSALIGLPITGIVGDLGFAVHGTNDTLGYEINLDASRLRAGLMRVHDARITIIGDAQNEGVVLIPEIIAGMHGGQIAGSAQIRPGPNGDPHYWMELHASGVRAAPVFDDLLLPPEGLVGPPRPGQTTVLSAWSLGEDLSRGAMIGDLTLTGPIGDPSKRSGRGLVQISGGSVVVLPGLLPLVEASNLSLPASSPLDRAEASFYVDGQIMAFEQLSASSKRIEILGYGTMDWSTQEVDLRFKSRSVHPIPIVSKLLEQLRDELITTRVTGPLGDPKYSVQQFGSTKRVINAMLGNPVSDQQRRLREVEDQVQAGRLRSLRAAQDTVHFPVDSTTKLWDWADDGS
ncbi:MAG: hypothetical protein JKX70_10150 [Phycisphaerales bacterium]|nr:hypothetical protein [Phycisphaerales bacterium]